jgi:hypothetical protein
MAAESRSLTDSANRMLAAPMLRAIKAADSVPLSSRRESVPTLEPYLSAGLAMLGTKSHLDHVSP